MPRRTATARKTTRRSSAVGREAFLRALQSQNDDQIEACWPGAIVAKRMLADKVIAYHNDGDYSITDLGLAELEGPGTAGPEHPLADQDGDPSTWDNRGGSSVNSLPEDEPASDGLEIEAVIGATCACGCSEPVTSTRHFRQGHDQRLIGILARVAASGREVSHTTGSLMVTGSARAYGARVLSDSGLAKLDDAIARATHKPRPDKGTRIPSALLSRAARSRQVAKPSGSQTGTPATDAGLVAGPGGIERGGSQPGDEIKVRVGRHVYFARIHGMSQSGKVTAVRFATKAKPEEEKITEKFTIVD
jgi:hypothetical protein